MRSEDMYINKHFSSEMVSPCAGVKKMELTKKRVGDAR